MVTVIIFLMIFVGVTVAWCQIYQMHLHINTRNDAKLSGSQRRQWETLTEAYEACSTNQDEAHFDSIAARLLGGEFNRQALHIAFSQEGREAYGAPLLRRKRALIRTPSRQGGTQSVSVRHLLFFKTRLPSINIRSALILLGIANCGMVQLLAAMSIYTIHYDVSISALEWVNQPTMILLAISGVVILNYLISTLDAYLNDLYQVRKLGQLAPVFH